MNHRASPKFFAAIVFLSMVVGLVAARLLDSMILLKRADNLEIPNEDKSKEISLDGLVESVLTIVESYYVDEKRVDPSNIVENLVNELERQYINLQAVQSGEKITLKIDDESLALESKCRTHDALRKEIYRVIDFVSDNWKQFRTKEDDGSQTPENVVIAALISSLDAHSSLLSASSYRDLRQGTEGSFGGLGILVGMKESALTVIKPLPNSPAFKRGVQSQDKILSINSVDTFGIALEKLVDYMRGDPGTVVDLVTLRDKDLAPRKIKLQREVIQVSSVNVELIPFKGGNIVKIGIESFSARTAQETLSAIQLARKRGPIAGLILDLRSNPGGLLDQAVQVSDIFLKSGVIVSTKGRKEEVERAGRGYDELEYPVFVLTNEESASASEIVAGALQDHKRALVIGQKTFGKGSVQTVFELPRAQALKLTIARYYTPLNRSIQNRGIVPDILTQPILRNSRNINLFGKSHYFSEHTLLNHLASESDDEEQEKSAKKIFYMQEGEEKKDSNKIDYDIETKIATLIIEQVHRHYPWRLPESARRASHWLALSSAALDNFEKNHSQTLLRWIANTHGIRWDDRKEAVGPHVSFHLGSEPEDEIEIAPGKEKILHWRVSNTSSKSLHRSSINLRVGNFGFEAQERLIGLLQPKESVRGYFEIKAPKNVKPGRYEGALSLAIDGENISHEQRPVRIVVRERNFAKARLSAKFVESSASRIPNTLESNERCRIVLSLANISNQTIHSGKIRVLNFSGQQVLLKKSEEIVSIIAPGQLKKFEFDAQGADSILFNRHQIGFVFESEDTLEDQFALAVIGEGNTDLPTHSLAH